MHRTEALELIRNGEGSGTELKRDDIQNHDLAKEIVALLNLRGGTVLLGVEDDGTICGTRRERLEEWVTELCRKKIEPPIIPYLTWLRELAPGCDVLAVRVPTGLDKPYARVHNDRRTYFVRVGSTSREASRDELERMFQASGRVRYGAKPVPGTSLDDLDRARLQGYLHDILKAPPQSSEDRAAFEQHLVNLELLTREGGDVAATVDGLLLFGRTPKRFLPHSGIRALAYAGERPELAASADQSLNGPMVPRLGPDGDLLEAGLVEQALDFVRRNIQPSAHLADGARRVDRPAYPEAVLREVVVNALVHRDYTIAGTDIELAIFADRLEVRSPGRLPNTATVEALRTGFRYARNQTLVNIMRDLRYVEHRGMGIREKVIPGMRAHNGTEPDLIESESAFTVRLWR